MPLVEAMAMDVPVLAYGAAAVPETLGGAGVTFAPKDLEYAAELLGGLVYDAPFRRSVLDGQRPASGISAATASNHTFRPRSRRSAYEPRAGGTRADMSIIDGSL